MFRLDTGGTLVDLIPTCRARETSGSELFNKRSGQAVHTDVTRHVHLIANSGRQQEICALKIWRQLADNILAVFRHLSSKFEQSVIADPANSDNILSSDLSASGKKAVAKAARDAIYDENWKKILW
jgi:hypothetical protein